MIEPTDDGHLSTAVSVVNCRQRKPAASPQPHRGGTPSLCRLSAARKQQRRSGRESRLSADGWSGRVLGAGIPQLLSTRLLHRGRPRSWSDPLHSVLRDERRQLLPRLQPSHRLAAFEQLRLWGRLRFWCFWLWRVCFLMEYVYLIRRVPTVVEMLGNLKIVIFKPRKAWERKNSLKSHEHFRSEYVYRIVLFFFFKRSC